MRDQVTALGLALVVLLIGFALAETGPGAALGEAVAQGLASLAAPLLRLADPGLSQVGTILRGSAGWAVRVSEVCDGHGLAISLAAGLVATGVGLRRGGVLLALGLVAIQAFNLLRIVALALVLDGDPASFDLVHAGVFPYLSVVLLALCLLPLRQAAVLALAALPLVVLWLAYADTLAAGLVAPANLVLSAVSGPEVGQIAFRAAGWTIGTGLMADAGAEGVSRFLAPLRPADFALALPVLLAAVLVALRPSWLVWALLSILAALVIAAITTVWTLAQARAPAVVLLPDGAGGFLTQDFSPPKTGLALLRLAQSALVHLNLLVLPALVLARGRGRG